VYLGFLGDDGIADAGAPFTDTAHWETTVATYAHSLVPQNMFERRIDCASAPLWLQVRSRRVLEASPAKPSNAAVAAGTASS
jgi:hypothetical protein